MQWKIASCRLHALILRSPECLFACLEERDSPDAITKKVYTDTLRRHIRRADNQLIGPVRRSVQIWGLGDVVLPPEITENDFEENREKKFLSQPKQVTRVVWAPSLKHVFITVVSKRAKNYLKKKVGGIYDC